MGINVTSIDDYRRVSRSLDKLIYNWTELHNQIGEVKEIVQHERIVLVPSACNSVNVYTSEEDHKEITALVANQLAKKLKETETQIYVQVCNLYKLSDPETINKMTKSLFP